MSDNIKRVLCFIPIIGLLIGPSFWGDVLNTNNNAIRIFGCIFTLVSLLSLIFLAIMQNVVNRANDLSSIKKEMFYFFSALGALLFCACIFSFFCYVDVVPVMPQDENMRTIYGLLSLFLMIGGGGSTGASTIIIIFL